MSEKTQNGEAKRLTLDDPVSPETIAQFQQLSEATSTVALDLLALEERKIQLLAISKKLREQHDRLFQGILVERGQPPQAPAELDTKTRKILLKTPPPQAKPSEAS